MSEKNMARREEQRTEEVHEAPTVSPRVDIYENNDEILLVADMPGVGQEDIALRLDKNELTIEGQRSNLIEATVLAAEYRPYDYRRVFTVPKTIDPEKIHAELKEGVLTVHLTKSAAYKPREIKVQVG